MEWIEITAKTVDAAKERALDELGIADDEAEFVVLEEPKRGLFGMQRGSARVRARVQPRAPRAKAERRGRRGRKSSGGETAKNGDGKGPKQHRQRSGNGGRKDSAGSGSDKSRKSSERGRNGDRSSKGSAPRNKSDKGKQESTMAMTLDEQVTESEKFLTGLLEAMGVAGEVSTERVDDANAHVNITGDDLGLLIGPRGRTMNAIQDLTRVTLQKKAAGSWEGHVHVDVNGYRAKRREALVAFVQKVAADVLESGTPKALEPMSSSDRKIVHDAVNEIDGVTTSSEGRDPRRWVQISPEDA